MRPEYPSASQAREAIPEPAQIRIHPVPHPNAQVRQVGFPIDHAYVEQVWAGVVGPSALLLLRRIPVLWHQQGQLATVALGELGQSLGLGSRIAHRSVERLVRFGMAGWLPSGDLAVPTRVAPLSARQLRRVTPLTRQAHYELLGAHLDRLARTATPAGPDPTGRVTARLDHLEQTRGMAPRGLTR
jgi:hypothetical protein